MQYNTSNHIEEEEVPVIGFRKEKSFVLRSRGSNQVYDVDDEEPHVARYKRGGRNIRGLFTLRFAPRGPQVPATGQTTMNKVAPYLNFS